MDLSNEIKESIRKIYAEQDRMLSDDMTFFKEESIKPRFVHHLQCQLLKSYGDRFFVDTEIDVRILVNVIKDGQCSGDDEHRCPGLNNLARKVDVVIHDKNTNMPGTIYAVIHLKPSGTDRENREDLRCLSCKGSYNNIQGYYLGFPNTECCCHTFNDGKLVKKDRFYNTDKRWDDDGRSTGYDDMMNPCQHKKE